MNKEENILLVWETDGSIEGVSLGSVDDVGGELGTNEGSKDERVEGISLGVSLGKDEGGVDGTSDVVGTDVTTSCVTRP